MPLLYHEVMRGKWALFGGIVILGAAAAGALTLWRKQSPPPAPAAEAAAPALPPGTELSLPGKIEAREVVGVQSPSNGTIAEYLVIVGEEVFEGQLLARIKNPGLEAEQQQAKEQADRAQERLNVLESQLLASRLESSRGRAEVARLQDDYSRLERNAQRQEMLNREGATPRNTYQAAVKDFNTAKLEYDAATARLKIADARVIELAKDIEASKRIVEEKNSALEEADSNLQATQIHAPVDGIILDRKGEAGIAIHIGEENIVRIATDLGQLQVVIEPEPEVLKRLRPGSPAEIILAEMAATPLNAEVNRIEGTRVILFFGSPDPAIKPGLTAQVKIKLP